MVKTTGLSSDYDKKIQIRLLYPQVLATADLW